MPKSPKPKTAITRSNTNSVAESATSPPKARTARTQTIAWGGATNGSENPRSLTNQNRALKARPQTSPTVPIAPASPKNPTHCQSRPGRGGNRLAPSFMAGATQHKLSDRRGTGGTTKLPACKMCSNPDQSPDNGDDQAHRPAPSPITQKPRRGESLVAMGIARRTRPSVQSRGTRGYPNSTSFPEALKGRHTSSYKGSKHHTIGNRRSHPFAGCSKSFKRDLTAHSPIQARGVTSADSPRQGTNRLFSSRQSEIHTILSPAGEG